MGTLNETFRKVTGNTWDLEALVAAGKIAPKKLNWMIPDGAMLNNVDGQKYIDTQAFLTAASASNINLDGKTTAPRVETTINETDPTKKPTGKGWKKVVDPGQEAVEAQDEYWTINNEETHYSSEPQIEHHDAVAAQDEVLYTAEDEEVIAGTKQVGDVKTPAVEAQDEYWSVNLNNNIYNSLPTVHHTEAVPAQEAVAESYHWERTIIEG